MAGKASKAFKTNERAVFVDLPHPKHSSIDVCFQLFDPKHRVNFIASFEAIRDVDYPRGTMAKAVAARYGFKLGWKRGVRVYLTPIDLLSAGYRKCPPYAARSHIRNKLVLDYVIDLADIEDIGRMKNIIAFAGRRAIAGAPVVETAKVKKSQ
jgi:hypothetical protein